ncbi:MAG: hypothetical protein OEQ18_04245 [Gammaproteobacteria bacterium]|nr:hypothetical protein [Gammaproteobacteria bacterium]
MLHMYREMLADWQSMQRQFWSNPWLANLKIEDSAFPLMNPWAKSWFEQSLELQHAWLKKWQEATGLADQLPSTYAGTFQEASEYWVNAQRQIWTTWIGMYQGGTSRTAAGPVRKIPADTRAQPKAPIKSTKPRAAAPEQLKLDTRDDLKQISGIGPGLEKKLNAQGIVSFRQIAGLTKSDIEHLEETVIKFPGRVKRDNWIGQAKKLAQA